MPKYLRVEALTPAPDLSAPIDHARIMDGFGELARFSHYIPFRTGCGVCGARILVTVAAQKYLLEVKGVPVKVLRSGRGAYCTACISRRVRMKALCSEVQTREQAVELERLRAEVWAEQRGRRLGPDPCDGWPYPYSLPED